MNICPIYLFLRICNLGRSLLFVIILTLTSYLYADDTEITLFSGTGMVVKLPIKTWKDLRDSNIEKQDKDYSCGSAAAATILRYYYDKEVYERDILDEVIKVGDDGKASFLDLEQAIAKFGFKTKGVKISFADLKKIQIPAIAYLRHLSQNHFSVIRGISNAEIVWLGDPSWGNRKFSEKRFRSMWETLEDGTLRGKILLIFPEDMQPALHPNFFRVPQINPTAIQLITLRMINSRIHR